jgi:hypothetical protein
MRLPFTIVVAMLMLRSFGVGQNFASSYTANEVLPNAPSAVTKQPKEVPRQELLADDAYRPLTKRQKMNEWLRHTYAPSTFLSAGVDTAYTGVTNSNLYCCGSQAWLQQYGASLADAQSRNFFGKFFFPAVLKQDPRFLPKREGGFWSRTWYAASRVLITRTDDGRSTFNSSEFLGIAFSKGLSNAYYPEHDRTFGRTANDILGALQGDASGYLLSEFAPDIKRIFRRHAPKAILNLSNQLATPKHLRTEH